MGKRTWTGEQLEILSENYRRMSMKELSKMTGHPEKGVEGKARELGLKKRIGDYLTKMKQVNLRRDELGYIAGFTDADGSVTILQKAGKKVKLKFYPYVRLSNSDRRVIDWFKVKVPPPGTYTETRHTGGHAYYIYNIKGMSFLPFYLKLEPLLVIKRDRMKVMLAWIESRLKSSTYEGYSDYEMKLIEGIRWLNLKPSRQSESERPTILESVI